MAGLNWGRSRREVMMAAAATEQRLQEATLEDAAVFGHSGFGGDPVARDDYREFRQSLKEQLYGGRSTETRTSGTDKVKPPANRQPTSRTQTASPRKPAPSVRVIPRRPPAPTQGWDAHLTRLLDEIRQARRQGNASRVHSLCLTAFGFLGQGKKQRAGEVRPMLMEYLAWAKANVYTKNGKESAPRHGSSVARPTSTNRKTVRVNARKANRKQPEAGTAATETIKSPGRPTPNAATFPAIPTGSPPMNKEKDEH